MRFHYIIKYIIFISFRLSLQDCLNIYSFLKNFQCSALFPFQIYQLLIFTKFSLVLFRHGWLMSDTKQAKPPVKNGIQGMIFYNWVLTALSVQNKMITINVVCIFSFIHLVLSYINELSQLYQLSEGVQCNFNMYAT